MSTDGCPATFKGEPCVLEPGHAAGHVWIRRAPVNAPTGRKFSGIVRSLAKQLRDRL